MIFGTSFFVNKFNELGIVSLPFLDSDIPFVPSTCCLGVVLDSKLNWNEHILYICKRANTLMYRPNHFRRGTNFELRKHLIQSLLFPLVHYCCSVFCDISKGHKSTLQRVLNTEIRYIFGIRKSEHISPYRRQLGWLRVAGRREYFAACLLYKILSSGCPSYMTDFFIAKYSVYPVRGENPPTLVVPNSYTESLRRSFHVTSSILWNSIPLHIRTVSSLITFKRLINRHIFTAEGDV